MFTTISESEVEETALEILSESEYRTLYGPDIGDVSYKGLILIHQPFILVNMESLDLQGKVCPFVLFHTKKKLETIPIGEKLEVITDDPTAKDTISGWCKTHHHEVLEIKYLGTHIKIVILKH